MQYVAHQTPLRAEEVEILLVKGSCKPNDNLSTVHPPISMEDLQILKGQETLAGLKVNFSTNRDRLVSSFVALAFFFISPGAEYNRTDHGRICT